MQFLNDSLPWTEGIGGDLSIVDLIMNGTIPVRSAAMLWWSLERGASMLTAGGPSGAGKSTLANACLGFLPKETRAYAVAGRDDPLLLPSHVGPTYLVVSELSNHGRPFYISGPAARRVFALVRGGQRIVGTLHADSVAEALAVLSDEVELSREDIACIDLIAVTRVDGEVVHGVRGRRGHVPEGAVVRRRIVEIGVRGTDSAGALEFVALASWDQRSERLEPAKAPAGVAALARWAGVPMAAAEAGIAERARVLERLATESRQDPRDVSRAVEELRAK